MRVKKFEAKNMKDALQMVKNELGPDAVILQARDNRRSFGLGGEASVEITAAVSESTLQKKRFVESRLNAGDKVRFQDSNARTQRQIIDKMVDRRVASNADVERARPRPITTTSYIDIPDEVTEPTPRRRHALERATGRNVRELLQDFEQDFIAGPAPVLVPRPAPRGTPMPVRAAAPIQAPAQTPIEAKSEIEAPPTSSVPDRAIARIRSAAREAWNSGLFTDEKPAAASGGMDLVPTANPIAAGASEKDVASLKGEIDRLHKMIEGFQKVPQTLVGMHPGADFGIPYDLSFMYQKLIEAGLTVDNSVEILQHAGKELDALQIKKRSLVDAWVARWFLNQTQIVSHPFQGRLHLFVGGSGSGKTSQLVKLASHLVVKEKKKVAILSTDAFKVGAVDQLKIYCQILNVPFAVMRNRKDWEWVMGQLKHIDHILVDFPGFQLRDLDEIHLLKSLLPPSTEMIQATPITHLCVAATAKDGDAYDIARRYKVTDYHDVIVTNLDQSVQHGIIYNIQKKTGRPLHSFGIGSRIPEDFEPASKERVLDLIFKLTKLKREMK